MNDSGDHDEDDSQLDSTRDELKMNSQRRLKQDTGLLCNEEEVKEEHDTINIALTIQQGSFLPAICLIEKQQLDPAQFIVDYNTGAKVIHYTAHCGKVRALAVLVEKYNVDTNDQDYFQLTPLHYAARAGKIEVFLYLKNRANFIANDKFGHTPIHYAVMYGNCISFLYLYFRLRCSFNSSTLQVTFSEMTKYQGSFDMVKIMENIKELRPMIPSIVLLAAARHGHYILVEWIFSRFYKEISEEQFQQTEYLVQDSGIHKLKFQQLYNKALIKNYFRTGNNKAKVKCSWLYIQLFASSVWKSSAKVFSFLAFLIFQGLLLGHYEGILMRDLLVKDIFSAITNNYILLTASVVFLLQILVLLLFLFSAPTLLDSVSIHSQENIIYQTIEKIERTNGKESMEASKVCLTCLNHKFVHAEHCLKCDRCVKDFQFHSKFFNQCVGEGTFKPYVWFIILSSLFSFVLSLGFISISDEYQHPQTSSVILRQFEVHIMSVLNLEFGVFVPLYIAEMYCYMMLGRCFIMFSAMSRNLTLNEFEQPWNYTYLFEPYTFSYPGEKRVVYKIKHHGFCTRVYFLLRFFFSCKKKELRKQLSQKEKIDTRRRKQKGDYGEVEMSSLHSIASSE